MGQAGTASHVSFKPPSEHGSNQIRQQKSTEFTFLKVFLLIQVHTRDEPKGSHLSGELQEDNPTERNISLKKDKIK